MDKSEFYNEVKGPNHKDNYLSKKIGTAGNNYIRIIHINSHIRSEEIN